MLCLYILLNFCVQVKGGGVDTLHRPPPVDVDPRRLLYIVTQFIKLRKPTSTYKLDGQMRKQLPYNNMPCT